MLVYLRYMAQPGFPLRSAPHAESLRSGSGADFADCGVGGVDDVVYGLATILLNVLVARVR